MDVNIQKAGGPAANRRWRRMMLTAGLVLGGLLGGCSSNLQERVALLDEENGRLRASLDEKNGALDSMQRDLEDCRGEQVALLSRNADLEAMESGTSADGNAFGQIPGVESSSSGGVITARMEGDVLFSSGQTQLRDSAQRSLNEVARVIRSEFPGTAIRVAGHTDSDPIVKTKDKFPTNYHLGFERAFAVREYLIGRGIPATSISVESFGPARPAGSKQRSRRVEISVFAG